MSVHASPNIVEDGLVLCLDAGNERSYPGSGTTWGDLSGNGYNGTLTNGPTYSSDNLGSINLDGIDDFSLGTIDSSIFSGAHSIGCWFYRRTIKTWSALFSNNVNTYSCTLLTFISSGNGLGINRAGVSATSISIDLGSNHLNKWIYCVMTLAGATSGSGVNVYAFMDGSLLTASGNLYWDLTTSSNYYIGRHYTNVAQIHDGLIPIVQVYNRALSQDEIKQNFNAQRGRFGL